MARRLGQTDVARDDRVVHARAEIPAQFFRHLRGEVQPVIVHCEQHALNVKILVQPPVGDLHRRGEIGHALHRVILALQRHEQAVRRGEGVERQNAQRRRAVDEYVVEIVPDRVDRFAQAVFAPLHVGELDLRARKIGV